MEDKAQGGLLHIPTGGALALSSTRTGMIARGRRDAANTAANPEYRQGVGAYNSGDFAAAAASFRVAAEAGHAESQYLLSTMYEAGKGVAQDAAEAAAWERKAAEQGQVYALANVSFRCYAAGEFAEAFRWCEKAAEGRLAWAQYHLGLMYRKGEGVEQNDADAAYWFRQAATQEFAEAQQRLADMYYLGEGVPRSYVQAAMWYRRAAEHGNAEAQFQLGHLYNMGLGVEHDYTEYRDWTRKAAAQGHEEAGREVKRREYRDA